MRHLGLLVLCAAFACGGSSNKPDPEGGDPAVGDPAVGDPAASDAPPDKEQICTSAMNSVIEDNAAAWDAVLAKGAPSSLEDLAAAACQRFCGRSTECAVEDACETMSAAEVADLQFEKTAPENTRQCVDKCSGWRLTKEQIQTLGNCSQNDESTCSEFRDCTAAAQP